MSANTIKKDKIWAKIRKTPDVDLCIKQTNIAGAGELIQIRDFLRTRKLFGRGVVFPARLLPELVAELQSLQHHLGGTAAGAVEPGPDHGKLF